MIRRGLVKTLTIMIWVFGLAALAAVVFAIIGVAGLFGVRADPFAAIFAILLAMPWYLLLDSSAGGTPDVRGFAVLLGGIALNFGILLGLRWWLRRGLAA